MKILVFSDTHGNYKLMRDVIMRNSTDTDLVIHLGDKVEDADNAMKEFSHIAFLYVYGNCDFVPMFKTQTSYQTVTLDGVKLMYTHGHRYAVNSGVDNLVYQAKIEKANIVLYGHTHVSLCETKNGVTVLNPGSLGFPRDSKGPSYGVIIIDSGKFTCEIVEVEE